MKPTPNNIQRILETLDWLGHVELPIGDMRWLAAELSVRLSQSSFIVCDGCGYAKALVVYTGVGALCEDCIGDARRELREARFALEDEV